MHLVVVVAQLRFTHNPAQNNTKVMTTTVFMADPRITTTSSLMWTHGTCHSHSYSSHTTQWLTLFILWGSRWYTPLKLWICQNQPPQQQQQDQSVWEGKRARANLFLSSVGGCIEFTVIIIIIIYSESTSAVTSHTPQFRWRSPFYIIIISTVYYNSTSIVLSINPKDTTGTQTLNERESGHSLRTSRRPSPEI